MHSVYRVFQLNCSTRKDSVNTLPTLSHPVYRVFQLNCRLNWDKQETRGSVFTHSPRQKTYYMPKLKLHQLRRTVSEGRGRVQRARAAAAGACLQSVIVSAILSICVRYVSNWYVQLRLLPASPGVCEKCGYEFLSSAKGEARKWSMGKCGERGRGE